MNDDNVVVKLYHENVNIIAMALDRFSCEIPENHPLSDLVNGMMVFFNDLADDMEDNPVVRKTGNLLEVDFTPKDS